MVDINWSLGSQPKNFLQDLLQGQQAGQQMRTQKARQSALAMFATNPDEAQQTLAKAGDWEGYSQAGQMRQQQTDRQTQLTAAQHAKELEANSHLLQAVAGLASASPDPAIRKQQALAMAPMLSVYGVTPDLINKIDYSDQGLKAVSNQLLGYKDQLERDKPISVAPDTTLLDPTDHHVIFHAGAKPDFRQITKPDGSKVYVQINATDGGDAASPGGAPTGQFGDFYSKFVAPHEGGYTASDGNGAPANFGINQKANPDVNVRDLTPEKAQQIMHDRYWVPSGADKLPPGLAEIQADTAINMGVGAAHNLLQQSGGDPQKYLQLREERYKAIAAHDPSKVSSLPTWLQRNKDLGDYVAGTTAAGGYHAREIPGTESSPPPDDSVKFTPQAIDGLVDQMLVNNGKMPAVGQGKAGTAARIMLANRYAEVTAARGLTATGVANNYVTRHADSAALNKLTTTLDVANAAENTAKGAADLVVKDMDGFGGTRFPLLNKALMSWNHNTGDPKVDVAISRLGTFTDEYAKVIAGGTGNAPATDSVRADAKRRINEAGSPEQIKEVISSMKQEMAIRTGSLADGVDTIKQRLSGAPADRISAAKARAQTNWNNTFKGPADQRDSRFEAWWKSKNSPSRPQGTLTLPPKVLNYDPATGTLK